MPSFCRGIEEPSWSRMDELAKEAQVAKREAHSKHVPLVFGEDGEGDGFPARCVHCGERIAKAEMPWGQLAGDPSGVWRPVHERCAREYSLFSRAMGI
jgi:hypothetical protein